MMRVKKAESKHRCHLAVALGETFLNVDSVGVAPVLTNIMIT